MATAACTKLKKLTVQANVLVSANGFKSIGRCPNLDTLVINKCPMVSDQALKTIGEGCPKLRVLDVSGCGVSGAGLLHVAKGCRQLRMLDVSGCRVDDAAIAHVATNCVALEEIRCARCPLTDVGLRAMLAVRTLRALDFAETHASVRDAVVGCSALTKLDMTGSNFNEGELARLLAAVPRLTDLSLGSLMLGGEAIATVARCINLRALRLSSNRTHDAAFERLSALGQLESLSFIGANISGAGLAAIGLGCPLIESLDLSNGCFAEAALMGLQHFPCLTSLSLHGCNALRSTGVAQIVVSCPKIRTLDLSLNPGVADGAMVQLRLTELEHLNILGCLVSDTGLMNLPEYCPKLLTLVCGGAPGIRPDRGSPPMMRGVSGLQRLESPVAMMSDFYDSDDDDLMMPFPEYMSDDEEGLVMDNFVLPQRIPAVPVAPPVRTTATTTTTTTTASTMPVASPAAVAAAAQNFAALAFPMFNGPSEYETVVPVVPVLPAMFQSPLDLPLPPSGSTGIPPIGMVMAAVARGPPPVVPVALRASIENRASFIDDNAIQVSRILDEVGALEALARQPMFGELPARYGAADAPCNQPLPAAMRAPAQPVAVPRETDDMVVESAVRPVVAQAQSGSASAATSVELAQSSTTTAVAEPFTDVPSRGGAPNQASEVAAMDVEAVPGRPVLFVDTNNTSGQSPLQSPVGRAAAAIRVAMARSAASAIAQTIDNTATTTTIAAQRERSHTPGEFRRPPALPLDTASPPIPSSPCGSSAFPSEGDGDMALGGDDEPVTTPRSTPTSAMSAARAASWSGNLGVAPEAVFRKPATPSHTPGNSALPSPRPFTRAPLPAREAPPTMLPGHSGDMQLASTSLGQVIDVDEDGQEPLKELSAETPSRWAVGTPHGTPMAPLFPSSDMESDSAPGTPRGGPVGSAFESKDEMAAAVLLTLKQDAAPAAEPVPPAAAAPAPSPSSAPPAPPIPPPDPFLSAAPSSPLLLPQQAKHAPRPALAKEPPRAVQKVVNRKLPGRVKRERLPTRITLGGLRRVVEGCPMLERLSVVDAQLDSKDFVASAESMARCTIVINDVPCKK